MRLMAIMDLPAGPGICKSKLPPRTGKSDCSGLMTQMTWQSSSKETGPGRACRWPGLCQQQPSYRTVQISCQIASTDCFRLALGPRTGPFHCSYDFHCLAELKICQDRRLGLTPILISLDLLKSQCARPASSLTEMRLQFVSKMYAQQTGALRDLTLSQAC